MKTDSCAGNARKTIVFKLIITVIAIFLVMICILYVSINYYQGQVMESIAEKMEVDLQKVEATKEDALLIFKSGEGPSQTEFFIYTAIISLLVTGIGTIIFYMVITRLMKPLNQLAKKVSAIDVEKASYEKNEILIERGGLEIQELSRALDRAFSEIYESYERQRLFSINVAHEVRTPLAILAAKIDVFKKKKTKDPAEVDEFVRSMKNNISRLSEMVEGIMLLGRDQGLQLREVSLYELLEEILFDFEDMAAEKGIALHLSNAEIKIHTDEQLLERALFNLIENAIKYTEQGGRVDILAEVEGNRMVIRIVDTGVGISEEDKHQVFTLFYRVDGSRNRQTGGSGIGLALVLHIVNRLGGTVNVRDNVPKGSVFELFLPLKPQKQ